MNLRELGKNWNLFGKRDPLWAILTWPEKKGGGWGRDEFFETGERDIDGVIRHAESLGLAVRRRKALDFGCGAGRLTQALARHFDEVSGVDIAPSMVRLARRYNRHGGKCKYHLNRTDDLGVFEDGTFDFIYSYITLQHMEPRYAKNYLKEFLRVLAPGGVLVFQLPTGPKPAPTPAAVPAEPAAPDRTLREAGKGGIKRTFPPPFVRSLIRMSVKLTRRREPVMEVYAIPRDEIVGLVEANGGKVVDVIQEGSAGPDWVSILCTVTKGQAC